jgi:hypothetical protein
MPTDEEIAAAMQAAVDLIRVAEGSVEMEVGRP